jgi:hypothetical protein
MSGGDRDGEEAAAAEVEFRVSGEVGDGDVIWSQDGDLLWGWGRGGGVL